MVREKRILTTGKTYHVFNKSVRNQTLFSNKKECLIFLKATQFYLQVKPPVKFSDYRFNQNNYPIDLSKTLVKVLAYCFMPTHYHFILTQLENNGIHCFIHRLATSYAHYLNMRNEQKGPVFQDQFKTVRVTSQEQLVHLSRYIHLNPVTSYLVENPSKYPYSSYNIYLNKEKSLFIDPTDVLCDFKNAKDYEKFVLNQKDYQRKLAELQKLIIE